MSTPSAWDVPHTPLPPWPGPTGRFKMVVVGLGGSGLAAVHRLLDHRVSVLGLDAAQTGQSAAGRNGGFLLAGPAHFYHQAVAQVGRDLARDVYAETVAAIRAIRKETPRLVDVDGSVRLAVDETEREDIAVHLDALRADGFSGQPWGQGGLSLPEDAVFHPQERLHERMQLAHRRGAWLHGDTRVLGVSEGEVLTDRGVIHCDGVVVAVDGALERLFPVLADRVRTVRLQMLATEPTDEVRIRGGVYHRYGYDYWQQRPDGRILLGGARDVGGEAEWGAAAEPSDQVQAALDACLHRTVGVQSRVTHRWAAQVAYTEDRWPILEEVLPRVWVTGAYSGTGNVMGWLGGRAAADRLVGRDSVWADLIEAAHAAASDNSGAGA